MAKECSKNGSENENRMKKSTGERQKEWKKIRKTENRCKNIQCKTCG